MLEQNLLIEGGKKESSGGRPASLYGLNPDMGFIIGIELLLNSFRMSIVNLVHEVIYEFESNDFDINNRDEAFKYIVNTLNNLIKENDIPKDKILGVGIGITGRVDGKKGVSYSYLHYDVPLPKMLSEQWNIPVFIENDTRLMTLGEKMFGFAREKQNVIYVNLSHGLGIGFISNGSLHNGESGFAGELGHIHFEDNDKLCVCGKKGCLQTVVSGFALEEQYRQGHNIDEKTKLNYKDILQLVYTGDRAVKSILIEMSERLGQGLSILVQTLNPGLIILGGRFAEIGELIKYPIIKGLSLYGLPQLVGDCEVKISALSDKSTMLGAYALVVENIFQQNTIY